jgi:hypothetical protein
MGWGWGDSVVGGGGSSREKKWGWYDSVVGGRESSQEKKWGWDDSVGLAGKKIGRYNFVVGEGELGEVGEVGEASKLGQLVSR